MTSWKPGNVVHILWAFVDRMFTITHFPVVCGRAYVMWCSATHLHVCTEWHQCRP